MRERDLRVGNVDLHVHEDGPADDDVAFVLIHGLAGSGARYRDVLPHLARVRRTLALDLPGFGRSDAPNGPYSLPWLAGAVRATMDAAGIARAVLVGHSMGGLVAMQLAAAEPARVDALVLAAPALPLVARPATDIALGFMAPALPFVGPRLYRRYLQSRDAERLVREMLARNVGDPEKVSLETVGVIVSEVQEMGLTPGRARAMQLTNRSVGWAITAGRESTWALARSLRMPTLIVWGDRDGFQPVATGEAAVRQIPGAQLVVLEGLGHTPFLDAPQRFAHSIVTFLGESPQVRV